MYVCPSVLLSVCPDELWDLVNYKNYAIGYSQRKFVSAACHTHSNVHKPAKTVAPTVLTLK